MITLIATLCYAGFYLGYASTGRIPVSPTWGIEKWAKQQKVAVRGLSFLILAVALGLSAFKYGLGAGSFYFSVLWMLSGSLCLLLSPSGKPGKLFLIVGGVISLLTETLFF